MPSAKDRRDEIVSLAAGVLGSENAAKDWMRQPAIGLNGQIPAKLVRTIAGTRLVEEYLMQMEHGVYV
ncbi:MbcA/ParS/Xre antitoxin family protein [Sphingopyxis sp. P8]|uniref:MbcA/ParS/Xre antitoxin family protein n=1 Tax=Sphingopyxis sp. P8 TaxID=2763256 RepID=UPI001D0A7FE6|nr:MbcA/ParS/Xre antitoxin family protein [Sphingopyxis sp. P8]